MTEPTEYQKLYAESNLATYRVIGSARFAVQYLDPEITAHRLLIEAIAEYIKAADAIQQYHEREAAKAGQP